jgi:hypothetical protein
MQPDGAAQCRGLCPQARRRSVGQIRCPGRVLDLVQLLERRGGLGIRRLP